MYFGVSLVTPDQTEKKYVLLCYSELNRLDNMLCELDTLLDRPGVRQQIYRGDLTNIGIKELVLRAMSVGLSSVARRVQ